MSNKDTPEILALEALLNHVRNEIDWTNLFDASVVLFIIDTFEKIALAIRVIEKINPSFSGALIAELEKIFPITPIAKVILKKDSVTLLRDLYKKKNNYLNTTFSSSTI